MGNGSEQQLQRELEDVLMDPSVHEDALGSERRLDGVCGDGSSPHLNRPSPVLPGLDPLSAPPPKLEMVLPVQTPQESELNERSYRGESAKTPSLHIYSSLKVISAKSSALIYYFENIC